SSRNGRLQTAERQSGWSYWCSVFFMRVSLSDRRNALVVVLAGRPQLLDRLCGLAAEQDRQIALVRHCVRIVAGAADFAHVGKRLSQVLRRNANDEQLRAVPALREPQVVIVVAA